MEGKNKQEKLGYFTLKELWYSRVALDNGLDNEPSEEIKQTLRTLVTNLLNPLRTLHGMPMYVTSGYRSEEINRRVGGVATSQHLKGEAVDLYTLYIERLLLTLKDSNLVFDQAIYYKKRGFLHLSLSMRGRNRKQVLFR